jgi:hypothetical protein
MGAEATKATGADGGCVASEGSGPAYRCQDGRGTAEPRGGGLARRGRAKVRSRGCRQGDGRRVDVRRSSSAGVHGHVVAGEDVHTPTTADTLKLPPGERVRGGWAKPERLRDASRGQGNGGGAPAEQQDASCADRTQGCQSINAPRG